MAIAASVVRGATLSRAPLFGYPMGLNWGCSLWESGVFQGNLGGPGGSGGVRGIGVVVATSHQ